MGLVGNAASAQHARFPRAQPTPTAPDLSDQVKGLVATPAATPPAATKPSISASDVLSIDGLRGQIRGEQEQILVQLIQNTPDSEAEEKSDYYFRLGELYAKQHKFWHDKAAELAAMAPTRANEAQAASNKAKEYLLKTVKTYKGLTDNDAFRNYPKMDMALFYYGYTLQSGKYMKEARAVYDKLLKNFPNSKYVPEAHLAFAEYYYEAGQLADAEARYKQVLEFPKSTIYSYALYRMGWIALQLDKKQDALEAFAKVVRETRNDKKQETVYRAAKADFGRTYVAVGKAQSVASFAKTADGLDLLDLVADAAWSEGSTMNVLAAYRELASRSASDPRACEWQYRIARATVGMPNSTMAATVKEVTALVKLTAKTDAGSDCRANAAAMTGELAATFYADSVIAQIAGSLEAAEQLYGMHVALAPEDIDAKMQYAEVLWTRADHEANAKLRRDEWKRAAEVFGGIETPDAKRATALAWMNAVDIVLPTNAKVALAARKAAKPMKLSEIDANLLTAISAATTGPDIMSDDEELAQMELAAALTWRRYRHFDEAVGLLDAFLEKHPDDARAELVANLLLDSMIQRGKPDETLAVVDAIAADIDFVDGKPELFKNLMTLRTRALRASR
ncbi:MAG TPA: tetratricopeptide repeat protein [Kofleriaceae bacterium]|nr:tetratricopeptide repeat protein [Kofleriaceae bacterium]